MKRTVPLLITSIVGFVLICSAFIPAAESWSQKALIWFDILAGIAFLLGGGNLVAVQFRKITRRQSGWGYAAVTLASFLITLSVGLLKVGSKPAPIQEYYGESFARLEPSELPAVSSDAPAVLEPVPASVRRQVSITKGETSEITLRGWLSPDQQSDLEALSPNLEWQCAIERLVKEAQLPESLRGRLVYHSDHATLGFKGVMSPEDEAEIRKLQPNSADYGKAVDALAALSRAENSVAAVIPPDLTLPGSLKDIATVGDGKITFQGPMSAAQRKALTEGSLAARRVFPLNDAGREAVIQQLTGVGPLSEKQIEVARNLMTEDLSNILIGAINTAGIAKPTPKSACELLEERNAGATDLNATNPPGPPSVLNDAQTQVIRDYLAVGKADWDGFQANLSAAGPVTPAQTAAIATFQNSLPTTGTRNRALFDELIKTGMLTTEQRDVLLAPVKEEQSWSDSVSSLFFQSHVVKYRWSGDFNQPGSAFWWAYKYIFSPITAMMFGLLAFYVASAAFRAFRAKNVEATLLLGTAFIILLGRTYAGVLITGWIPPDSPFAWLRLENLAVYFMKLFNAAGNRAIMIGIALGIASTSLKILLGIDRSHIGGRD
jgi:hypothetical protein